jgi:nucleotide-binding universal stress UspA family protein
MNIRLRKILAGFEVGPLAEPTVRHALELSKRFGAELVLVHVVEPSGLLASLPPASEGYVPPPSELVFETYGREQAEKLLAQLGATARVVIARGKPFLEIVRTAREEEADLIVIGTHGRNAFAQVLLGSTAELVVRQAPCPVLTVRQGQHEFAAP